MSFTLYHLLLATLAALALSGCTSPGGAMNWGPFQRRSEPADTLPLSTNPEVEATLSERKAARHARQAGGLAPKPVAEQQESTSGSWLPSWMGGSSTPTDGQPNGKSTAQARTDANPNLDAYQLPVGSRLAKGREFERAGQLDRARNIYQELIRQYPQAAEPYHRLGIVADKQHRYREAQELFIQSLQADPRNAEVRVDLGYCFYMQGQIPQAEAETRAALQLAPRNERAHNNLGLMLGAQDRIPEALEHFRRGGSEADAQFNLAFVYASRNNLPAAKECFQRALEIDPNHEKARKAFDSFNNFENQPDEMRQSMELAYESERRGTIPFVEPTVVKASAEGDSDASASGGTSSNNIVPAIGGRNAATPSVAIPRDASKAIHGLYNQARSQKVGVGRE